MTWEELIQLARDSLERELEDLANCAETYELNDLANSIEEIADQMRQLAEIMCEKEEGEKVCD